MRWFLLVLVSCCAAMAAPPEFIGLMPLPARIAPAAGSLAINGNFTVAATGVSGARLQAALERWRARILRQTGLISPAAIAGGGNSATLRVDCTAEGPAYPTLGEDESYRLDVTPEGAVLKAATVDGALRGMATFAQLIQAGDGGFLVPAVHIEDSPRFPWRGLLLDVCRHWMPVDVVERNLDAMEAVKLNIFHWHLSDDQGFRVESKRFPRLQELGSDGYYYTQQQVSEVVEYAAARGIRVVPEFDVPAHATSWFVGYPKLGSGPGPYQVVAGYGIFNAAMNPAREETYQFLDGFIGEMAELFPDPYFHIGGDEVNGKEWAQSAAVQAFALAHGMADAPAIQLYFNQRLLKIVQAHGKTMVGWDEGLQPGLPLTTVAQSWRTETSLADSASKGYRGILSWGYYLDNLQPAAAYYGVDPLAGAAARLTPPEASRILGGEACMWAEMVDAENVDSRIWPATAAIAERFWSPQQTVDADSMYARLEAVSRMLEWTGVKHRANYGPMLDRIAGNHPAPALRILADACEPLGTAGRRYPHPYTTATPLNRFVDAVRPESESVWHWTRISTQIGTGSSRPADRAALRAQFVAWAANDAPFETLAEDNPLMSELKPLSRNLAELGSIGLKSLDFLTAGQPAPQDWIDSQTKELSLMSKATAEVNLAAVRPVKVLLAKLAQKGH